MIYYYYYYYDCYDYYCYYITIIVIICSDETSPVLYLLKAPANKVTACVRCLTCYLVADKMVSELQLDHFYSTLYCMYMA